MNSLWISKFKDRSALFVVMAVTLLVVSTILPAFASAAQLTERSVALSSSSKAATGVSYNIKFTQATNAGAAVIQFCTNSPLIGEYCDAPTGIDVTGATAGAGVTAISSAAGSTIKLTKAGGTQDLTITGIVNPSTAGTVYARILTYADSTAAGVYDVQANTTKNTGLPEDQGSAAFAITETVSVSGAVLEALTFCVSKTELTGTDCTTGYQAPILTLGEDVGDGTLALSPTKVSTGDVYTKISTNALSGAVVSLKSTAGVNQPGNTPCAGLALYGTGACSIPATGTTGTFGDGTSEAKFGVLATLPAVNDGSDNNGIIALAPNYSTTDYRLDGAAAISTYGDPVFNTSQGYANNRNVKLTFGAKSANNTPAGKYSTAISLIATGTF